MQFSKRANEISSFIAMDFAARAFELEQAGHNIIKLGLGEPDFGPPPAFTSRLLEIIQNGAMPYTNALGLDELRRAISRFYKQMHGVIVPFEQIAVTSGASGALLLAVASLVNEGDEVLIGDPSYPCNREFMAGFGAKVKLVPTSKSTNFQLDYNTVVKNWGDKTKGLLIASPSNPTGTSVDFEELCKIYDFVKSKNGWCIFDEIYLNLADWGNDNHPARTILAHDKNAIVINSFSKYFSMTGYRLGWCVMPIEMVELFEKLAQNYFICAPTPAQIAAIECFSDDSIEICEQRRVELSKRRNYVLNRLAQIGLAVPAKPNGAFYIYIDVSNTKLSAMEFCNMALEKAHVSMTPGNDFGIFENDKYVRLSYASSFENLVEGLNRLEAMCKALRIK